MSPERNCCLEVDHQKMTPFYFSCQRGHIDCMRSIYDKDPSQIKIKSAKGCTPFYISSQKGNIGCMEFILEKDPSQAKEYCNGWTSLHVAIQAGKLISVEFIYEKIPDLFEMKTDEGRFPLQIAQEYNQLECIEFIKKKDWRSTLRHMSSL